MSEVVLEPAAQAFAEASAKPPFSYERSPVEARKVLDDVRAGPVEAPPLDARWLTVPAAVGDADVLRDEGFEDWPNPDHSQESTCH